MLALCTNLLKTAAHYPHMRNSCIDTHISCLSSPEPSPKALSHRNQRARRGIKAVYIMKLKELLHGVSLTAPRKAFLLLQRIEERRKKEKKKKKKIPPNNAAQQQRQQQQSITPKERQTAKMREHVAIERLFI